MELSGNCCQSLKMSEYIDLLISDFRTDHPGIVEEWERQREEALAEGDLEDDWPEINSPDGLAWWLDSEIRLSQDIASGWYSDAETLERERGIEAHCLAMLDDLER